MNIIINFTIAGLIFSNDLLATIFFRFYELYYASRSLSLEILDDYIGKISYEDEKIFIKTNQWYLFGFGIVVLVISYIPFVGLILYPTFLYASAKLIIQMTQSDKQKHTKGANVATPLSLFQSV